MRLIDANELSLAIDEGVKTVSKEVGLSKQLTRILLAEFAHTVLNEAPTVKAIPVGWLRMWFTKNGYLSGIALVDKIESDWKEENEQNKESTSQDD